MKRIVTIFFTMTVIVCVCFISYGQKTVPDFNLRSTDNKWISLKKYPKAKGFIIVFVCNHCPFANRYSGRMNILNSKYAPLGIPLIAVNSSDTLMFRDETFAKMVESAKKKKYNFPYLYDNTQIVGKNFSAYKTPQAFVIWKQNNKWVIEYNGTLDDNGAEPTKVVHAFIDEAVENLLAGIKVSTPVTKSIGCEIHYRNGPFMNFEN